MPDRILLSDLVDRLPGGGRLEGADVPISGVTHDSRTVEPGDLFVAIPGEHHDGHDYVDGAFVAGAAAVVVERDVDGPSRIVVPDARVALAWTAAAVYGDPSHGFPVVGVTGTNGKTTVTHMIERILVASGRATAIVGTVGARIGDAEVSMERTTPEASDLQRMLADMVDAGVEVAAIEVSSHALSLHRVDGVRFRVVAFTNLMQDHLDFHGDMQAYFEAKASLFRSERAERAVIAIDGDAGAAIAATTDVPTTTVAIDRPADVTATSIVESLNGSAFVVNSSGRSLTIDLPVPGRFNVENALIAVAVALELGVDDDSIMGGLASLGVIPGRFEHVGGSKDFDVIVDYAHTPDAIKAIVGGARRLTKGRVIVVFGAGGDRDREKRPAMGRAASAADVTILTSDNPRSEDPAAIMAAVRSGIEVTGGVLEEPDRRVAIRRALLEARPGDVVFVLGKGHEAGQETGGIIEPFDDRAVVLEELRSIGGSVS